MFFSLLYSPKQHIYFAISLFCESYGVKSPNPAKFLASTTLANSIKSLLTQSASVLSL